MTFVHQLLTSTVKLQLRVQMHSSGKSKTPAAPFNGYYQEMKFSPQYWSFPSRCVQLAAVIVKGDVLQERKSLLVSYDSGKVNSVTGQILL